MSGGWRRAGPRQAELPTMRFSRVDALGEAILDVTGWSPVTDVDWADFEVVQATVRRFGATDQQVRTRAARWQSVMDQVPLTPVNLARFWRRFDVAPRSGHWGGMWNTAANTLSVACQIAGEDPSQELLDELAATGYAPARAKPGAYAAFRTGRSPRGGA